MEPMGTIKHPNHVRCISYEESDDLLSLKRIASCCGTGLFGNCQPIHPSHTNTRSVLEPKNPNPRPLNPKP